MRHAHIYILIMCSLLTAHSVTSSAQLRSGYFMESYNARNNINPAMHSDSSYWYIPVLGHTEVSMQSTIGLGNILFDNGKGGLYTFMTDGTISKAELMDAVGSGVKTNTSATLTLANIGRRLSNTRFQTMGAAIKINGKAFIDKDLFDVMKDIENRDYRLSGSSIDVSAMLELSYGEARKINDHLTAGAKAKLLLGLINAQIKMGQTNIDMAASDQWTASGIAVANISGGSFKNETKQYDANTGTYEQVKDMRFDKFGINGIGVAIDAGISYKTDESWTLSAAVTDLGFVSWFNNRRAENHGDTFIFNGFQNTSYNKDDGYSVDDQWDAIHDDLMDLIHLEEKGKKNLTRMLGATFTLGAEYDIRDYADMTLGALLTHRQDGDYSWTEARINGTYTPQKLPLSIAISPAISTFGVSLGMIATVSPSKNTTLFLGSDHLFLKVNPQMIPTGMNGNIMLGMTMGI